MTDPELPPTTEQSGDEPQGVAPASDQTGSSSLAPDGPLPGLDASSDVDLDPDLDDALDAAPETDRTVPAGAAEPDADEAPVAPQSDPFDPFASPGTARPRRRRAASRPTGAARTFEAPEPVSVAVPEIEADALLADPDVTDEAVPDPVATPDVPTEPEAGEPTVPVASEPTEAAPTRRRSARRAAAPPTLTFQAPDLSELPSRPAVDDDDEDDDDPRSSDDDASGTDGRSAPAADSDADDESDGGRIISPWVRNGRTSLGSTRPSDWSSLPGSK